MMSEKKIDAAALCDWMEADERASIDARAKNPSSASLDRLAKSAMSDTETERRSGKMQIEPDMIVRNIVNGKTYRVRSVSNTKAVCWPCTRNGERIPYMGGTAVECDQANLRNHSFAPGSTLVAFDRRSRKAPCVQTGSLVVLERIAALMLAASAIGASADEPETIGCRSREAAIRLHRLALKVRPEVQRKNVDRAILGNQCRRFAPGELVKTNVVGWYEAKDGDGLYFVSTTSSSGVGSLMHPPWP